jgi:hypothetical protein
MSQNKWVECVKKFPPKNKKFLFSYDYGIGIGAWGQCFSVINGNSERTHEAYILVLNPHLMVGNQEEPFKWDENKMLDMEVKWMDLPNE